MIITGHDTNGDGNNDLFFVHRPLSARESAELGTAFVRLVAIGAVVLAVGFVGWMIYLGLEWLLDTLIAWSRLEWLLTAWIGLSIAYSLFVAGISERLQAPFRDWACGMAGISGTTGFLAALWSWSAATWAILSGCLAGLGIVVGAVLFILWDHRRHQGKREEEPVAAPAAPASAALSEGMVRTQCTNRHQGLRLPRRMQNSRIRCPRCHWQFKPLLVK